jgi:hypothetical protein
MAQPADATVVQRYLSVCCEAQIDAAAFSDGRRFLICSACGKVLAVEAKRKRGS